MPDLPNLDATSPACTLVGAAVWHSFDRALARAVRADAGCAEGAAAAPPAALDAGALALRAAVTDVVTGQGVLADGLSEAATVATLAERVRRYLGEELRGAPPADSIGAIHVYSALADVRARVGGATATVPDGCAALELAVEVGHDMRSPLSAILFLVDMLRTGRSGAVSELQQQQLALVYAAALGLNQLTCDLLDFVRGGDDLLDCAPSAFSLGAMLGGIHDLARPAAEEKGVVLHFELPARDERVGAPAALGRILLNLTTNAIRYTASGAVTVTVRELDRDRLEFSVQDAGAEIPPEVVPQLFQPFREGGAGVRAFSGSGLGLAICHRLVAALGSELRVSTSAGAGARFWFELDLPAV